MALTPPTEARPPQEDAFRPESWRPSVANQHLNARILHLDRAAGTIQMEFLTRDEFLNSAGMIHGGFVAAMLDSLLAGVLNRSLPRAQRGVTVEMKVSYVRPAPPGPLLGEARLVKQGRTLAFTEGRLLDPSGKTVATASMTLMITARNAPPNGGAG